MMAASKLLKFGYWILRRIYSEETYLDIRGDFEELYENRLVKKGKKSALFHFYIDVFLSIPNITRKWKQSSFKLLTLDAFFNYIKMGYRVLMKNPTTSFISIFGLATAVACAATASLWVDFQSNLDNFHTKQSRIYHS